MQDSNAPALSRGLYILELLSIERELSFSEIQEKTKINSSSLNRILKVLLGKDYITKNISNNYILSNKMLLLSQKTLGWQFLGEDVSIILNEISIKFGISVAIYSFSNKGITILNKVVHKDNIALREIGEIKRDYLLSPWGFLYVASINGDWDNFINKVKKNGWCDLKPPSNQKLLSMITNSKKEKYADDQGIIIPGIRRLAVPIYGINKELVAALGVGSIESLFNKQDIGNIVGYMKKKAGEINSLYNNNKI